ANALLRDSPTWGIVTGPVVATPHRPGTRPASAIRVRAGREIVTSRHPATTASAARTAGESGRRQRRVRNRLAAWVVAGSGGPAIRPGQASRHAAPWLASPPNRAVR